MKALLDKVPTDRPYRLILVGTREEIGILKCMMAKKLSQEETIYEEHIRNTIFHAIDGGVA